MTTKPKKPTITVYSVERATWWRSKTDAWRVFKREAKRHGSDRVTAKEYPGAGSHVCILGPRRAHGLPELAYEAKREELQDAIKRAEERLEAAKRELASLPPLGELEIIETLLP